MALVAASLSALCGVLRLIRDVNEYPGDTLAPQIR